MAAATVAYRYVTVLGPIKMEVVNLSSCSDTNTVITTIQKPLFAFGVVNTDAAAQTVALNAAVSGRTVTINQASLSSAEVTVMVFGF